MSKVINKPILRKADVITFFGNNCAEVGRAFIEIEGEPLSKSAVRQWPPEVPELRTRQLLDKYPGLRDFVVDPVTRMTKHERKAARKAASSKKSSG